ncbi:MAG TPA: (Fe-S)-binding protein [Candidatus Dormibacteraeota bacterium]|jgi:Fe-S oxidoreductase|nr:(Fe-S)-binding protein [Candidatus Dormibacteraeota bacterium]
MTDLLAPEQAMAARRCSSCPKMCRSACPTQAVTGNERHQPWGHARQVVEATRHEQGFVDPELVDGVYACATCSACTPPCHVDGVETPLLTWAARAAVHRAGATPEVGLEAVRQARAGMVLSDVPGAAAPIQTEPAPHWTDPHWTDPHWTDPSATLDALRPMSTPGADLVFFPGCGALGRRAGAVLAAGRALQALGIAFDVPEQHRCCGMIAQTFGDQDAAAEMSMAALHHAPQRISVQSPSCSYFLATRATDATQVEPLAATLARALAALTPQGRQQSPTTVAYHDPCYLARHQRRRDEPRAALSAAGYAVEELRAHGDTTQCSGQGGGLPLTHPDIAAGYLSLLTAQAQAAAATTVVTGCASCATALQSAGVDTLELAEAVDAALSTTRQGTGR